MVDPLTGNITFPDNPPRLADNGEELKDNTIEPETAEDDNEKNRDRAGWQHEKQTVETWSKYLSSG